ncbi:MAG: hypothetical protein RL021_1416 [Bacteroidota bacterium]
MSSRSALLLIVLLLTGKAASCSPADSAITAIDSLVRILQRGPDDASRFEANREFLRIVESRLRNDSVTERCPQIASNLSCVHAKGIRIMTWTVPSYDGDKYRYFGFIERFDPKTGERNLFPLTDSTEAIRKPESEKLSPEKWFGAAYYGIVERRKSGKTYYTLLGWKGKDRRVTQKVMEVLYFDGDEIRFGAPLFKKEKVYRSRVVFSFTSQAVLSLRYEPAKRMIIYDHLSGPKVPGSGTPDPALSGPDGSYDGYRFRSGHWQWYGDLKIKPKQDKQR